MEEMWVSRGAQGSPLSLVWELMDFIGLTDPEGWQGPCGVLSATPC